MTAVPCRPQCPPSSTRPAANVDGVLQPEPSVRRRLIVWKIPTAAGTFGRDRLFKTINVSRLDVSSNSIPPPPRSFCCTQARASQQNCFRVSWVRRGTLVATKSYDHTEVYHWPQEALMNGLIYLIGLIVVIMAILSFLGLH